MGRDGYLGMKPKWAIVNKRFILEDIEHSAAELAPIKGIEKIGGNEMAASRSIDHQGAIGKMREGLGIQEASGRCGQRQQADQNIRLFQKSWKFCETSGCFDIFDRLGPPAPACNLVTDRREMSSGSAAKGTKPQDTDPDLAGISMEMACPDALGKWRVQTRWDCCRRYRAKPR